MWVCMCVRVCVYVCVCVCVCVWCACVCVWCVYDHGGCGVWLCGCVGVVCRELIFGINPNLRVFANILHSCTDREQTGFTATGFEPGRRVLLELCVFYFFAPNLGREREPRRKTTKK